jgi:phosphatidate cytidylyltransferase
MHAKRLVVAAVLLPLFYLSVMKLPEVFFLVLLLTASIVAQWEFYTMYRMEGLMKNSGILFGVLLFVTADIWKNFFPHVLMFSVMGIAAVRLFGRRDPSSSLRDISCALLALLYIPGLLSFQLLLRQNGPEWIIFLFGCVWISDSFAYYVGKTLGRRTLYRDVSPNKTVAGGVGSLVGGAFSGWLLNLLLVHEMTLFGSLLFGLIIGAVTIVGDLVESMFKRDAGVKDSSSIIPGHGGVLDKIDGVLFAGPVLYWVSLAGGLAK